MSRITFQKRQKEMKRQEKQRMKAEKRAARKELKNAPPEDPMQPVVEFDAEFAPIDVPQKD